MRHSDRIEAEVEKTLGLLEMRTELEVGPYFYARLKHRIDSLNKKKLTRFPLTGLVELKYLRPAAVAVIVLINIFSGMILLSGDTTGYSGDTTGYQDREMYLEAFADEFSLAGQGSEQLSFY